MIQAAGCRSGIRGYPGPGISMRVSGSSMVLSAELPGFPRENVSVEVQGRTLVLRGRSPEMDAGVPVRLERRTGDFELGILLPEGLDPSGITASLRDGILEVSCPLGTAVHRIHVVSGDGGLRAGARDSSVYTERKERK